MSKKIIQVNEGAIKEELKELVRGSVEETLNDLLEKESQNCRRTGGYPYRVYPLSAASTRRG
jgi:hypothetical protein